MATTPGSAHRVTVQTVLLLDEMLSGTTAAHLRGKGHDVVAVVEDPTLVGTPDEELLHHSDGPSPLAENPLVLAILDRLRELAPNGVPVIS